MSNEIDEPSTSARYRPIIWTFCGDKKSARFWLVVVVVVVTIFVVVTADCDVTSADDDDVVVIAFLFLFFVAADDTVTDVLDIAAVVAATA